MKRRGYKIAVFVLACAVLCSCMATGADAPSLPATKPETPMTPDPADPVQELMDSMTLREKVGQLFLIRPDALEAALTDEAIADAKAEGVTAMSVTMRETLRQYPVGGFVLFGKNIESPQQLKTFVQELGGGCRISRIFGIDEEGGAVARLANHESFSLPQYESMAAVGATGDTENARQVGLTIGGYLREYGFNLDFAPVADVNTNPQNPVIGTRAFGSDPELVSRMVSAEIEGLHEAGVMSCIKHFPGHGDTREDTHLGYAATAKTWQEMLSCEILPFEAGIEAGTDMVMAAHITAEGVTSDGLPASLSCELLTEKLRGELHFQGVIITDSLAMGAITEQYTSAEAAIAALRAGVDILLMPWDFCEAFDGIVAAVENGELSEERLDESLTRILTLKMAYGLLAG